MNFLKNIKNVSIFCMRCIHILAKWLTNMTHLYVMSTTNLFHLEGSSRWNRVKRSRNQSARRSASRHEFRPISNIFQSKRLYRPAITIYLSSNALCYQSFAFIKSFKNERRIYIDILFFISSLSVCNLKDYDTV